jgi:hypothetical protein
MPKPEPASPQIHSMKMPPNAQIEVTQSNIYSPQYRSSL